MKFREWYDVNYRKLLIIPILLILSSLIYISIFYSNNQSFFYTDVSLTGGTSYTILTNYSSADLNKELSNIFEDFTIKGISDGSGMQTQLIISVSEENSEQMKLELEKILGFELNDDNTSIEFTSSNLSNAFLKQLYIAIILAFFWMGAVVFVIFGKGGKLKFWVIIINLIFAIFLGNFFFEINSIISFIIFLLFSISLFYIYIKNSVPSFAVILSAFANILMTLTVVNLMGLKLSTAGIVSFLMIIGYSVDTDIMLVVRLLKKEESVNHAILGAFKTGISMTITSIIAVAIALFVVYPFASVLNEIFLILLIGLVFDLMNTWLTNVSILKWYFDKKTKKEEKI